MRGHVAGFDPGTNTGTIDGDDGKRYDFSLTDWRSQNRPQPGDLVDFLVGGQRAAQIHPLEPEYVAPSLGEFLFSARGRVSRAQLWRKWLLPILAVHLLFGLAILSASAAGSYRTASIFVAVWVGFVVATLWPGVAILVKRIHDRNRSGWLALAYYIPAGLHLLLILAGSHGNPLTLLLTLATTVVTIWFFVEFGCMAGTFGVNRYGPDPVLR